MNDNITDELRDANQQIMTVNAEVLAAAKRTLTERDKKYLDYFWNRKTKTIRESFPRAVLCFFESETVHPSLGSMVASRVDADMAQLASKGYVEVTSTISPREYTLTKQGLVYLKDQHPRLIILFDRFWEKLPKPLTLAIKAIGLLGTVVGLVASVLGIVQYFR
jgi:hypothetical protein